MGYSRTVRAATPRSGQNLDGCSVTPPLEPPAIVFSKCPHSRFGDVVPIDLCMGMTSDNSGTHAASVGRRRGDIQGLRAVAVLLVVIYHADLGFSGGFVGVDVFFVISGYVITTALTTELGRTDRVNLGHFHLRRTQQVVPDSFTLSKNHRSHHKHRATLKGTRDHSCSRDRSLQAGSLGMPKYGLARRLVQQRSLASFRGRQAESGEQNCLA